MGQTPQLSTEKPDFFHRKQDRLHEQAVPRRRSFVQHVRETDAKAPVLTPEIHYHHISLFVDKRGRVRLQIPSTLSHQEARNILKEAIPKYRKTLGRRGYGIPSLSGTSARSPVLDVALGLPFSAVRKDLDKLTGGDEPHNLVASNHAYPTTKILKHPNKRRRSSPGDGTTPLPDEIGSRSTERSDSIDELGDQSHLVGIQIQDADKLREYLFDAFTSFQQINCRTLCKSWIRTIEPKKQVNHPYNGNLKVKGIQKAVAAELPAQKESDPEETKPRWWPAKGECPHKEPDHIKKEQRLALLCHILMNSENLHECKTEDLKKAIESDKAKIKPADKVDILTDVWKIGYALERYKDGQIDGTSEVLVTARKEEARMIRGGGRSKKAADLKEDGEENDSSDCPDTGIELTGILTPVSPWIPSTSRRYLEMGRPPKGGLAHTVPSKYTEIGSHHQFQPQLSRENYHPGIMDCDASNLVGGRMNDTLGAPGSMFPEVVYGEDPFANLASFADPHHYYPPTGPTSLPTWGTTAGSDLFSLQHGDEPHHPSSLANPSRDHTYGHCSYTSPMKDLYTTDISDPSSVSHKHPPLFYDEPTSNYQPMNSSPFSPPSTQGLHLENVVRHRSCDLPSHIRA